MYNLTLTKDERNAVEWIGDRYWNGNDLYCLLNKCTEEWDSQGDIEINVPEHVAWDIRDFYEENDCTFPCFSGNLDYKLSKWISEIV